MPNTHGPLEEHLVDRATKLCRSIDASFNGENCPKEEKVYGFVLMVFPFGEDDRNQINYMSNANRQDMINVMQGFIDRDKRDT